MGKVITITRQGDRLVVESNGVKAPLEAKSANVFQASGSPAELTFVREGTGVCRKLIVTLMGLREFVAVRLDP